MTVLPDPKTYHSNDAYNAKHSGKRLEVVPGSPVLVVVVADVAVVVVVAMLVVEEVVGVVAKEFVELVLLAKVVGAFVPIEKLTALLTINWVD
jgi:membrane-associated protease RseP (regulator of RpoE activity)